MDSVVDGFMPLIRQIETEVERVDAIIAGTNDELDLPQNNNNLKPVYSVDVSVVNKSSFPTTPTVQDNEKNDGVSVPTDLPSTLGRRVLAICSGIMSWVWARGKGIHGVCLSGPWLKKKGIKKNVARTRMLLRMTATRKVVTVMARLLAPKAEVLGQLKKRLEIVADLGAHLGDVQGACHFLCAVLVDKFFFGVGELISGLLWV
jgi:Mg2+ and Co2+ transporter CorA